MGTILIGSVLTVIIALVALLALLRAGIRRQERAACLACQPLDLSTALARRLAGLHVRQHTGCACPAAWTASESSLALGENEAPLS